MVLPPVNGSWDGVSYTFNKNMYIYIYIYIYITYMLWNSTELTLDEAERIHLQDHFGFSAWKRVWTSTEGKAESEAQIIVLKMVKTHHVLPKHWRFTFFRNLLNAFQTNTVLYVKSIIWNSKVVTLKRRMTIKYEITVGLHFFLSSSMTLQLW